MKRYIRLAAVSASATALLVSATACSNSTDVADTGGGEPTTVTLWMQNGANAPVIEEYAEKFNDENEAVQIEVVINAADTYNQQLPLALRTDQGPDVFTTAAVLPQLAQGGFLVPASEFPEDVREAFDTYLAAPYQPVFDGQAWSVPTSAITFRLAYNVDHLEQAGVEAPQTFEDLLAACEAMRTAGVEASCLGLPLKWGPVVQQNIDPLLIAETPSLSQNGLFNFDTEVYETARYEPVIDLIRQLRDEEYLYPGAAALDNDPMRSAFAEGDISMYVAASYDMALINTTFESDINWAVGPLPVADESAAGRGVATVGQNWGISSSTPHREAAMEVLSFITGPEVNGALAEIGNVFPLRDDVTTGAPDPQYEGFQIADSDQPLIQSPSNFLQIQGETAAQTVVALLLNNDPVGPRLEQVAQTYQSAFDSSDIDLNNLR